jgi:hypothetical protein
MIKILKRSTWNNIQGELERLKKVDRLLKDKGMTDEDLEKGRAHISWNPKKAPRVNVRAMMERDRAVA